ILPFLCFIAGFGFAWLLSQGRISTERNAADEKIALIEGSHQKLAESFKALSADALARNNQSFLQLATATFTRAQDTLARTQETARNDLELRQRAIAELVAPVRESLSKVDSKIQELERARGIAYAALHEQVRGLAETQ